MGIRNSIRPQGVTMADITDGLSNTAGVAEMAGLPVRRLKGDLGLGPYEPFLDPINVRVPDGFWAGRNRLQYNDYFIQMLNLNKCAVNCTNSTEFGATPYSYHVGGAHVLLADGSVRFLSESTEQRWFIRLILRNDGQVIDASF